LHCRNETIAISKINSNFNFKKITIINNNLNLNAMNALRNRVQLIGHVGQEPEIKILEGGKKVAKFSIATNESYYNENKEKVTDTQWHNIIAYGKTAEIIESFVTKGKEIGLDGKLTHRNWEDKDGIKRTYTEVVLNELMLMGSKN
jgi:single-strand DNA-binding protein